MEMLALKTMNERGDARTALNMAAKLVQARLEFMDEESTALTEGPLIKLNDVVTVTKTQMRDLMDQIAGLPSICKTCMVVLITLGKRQVTETTIGKLRKFVSMCTDNEDDLLSPDDFEHCLETLKDSGLLRLETPASLNELSNHQKPQIVVRLGLQLEDVQIAVDKVCKCKYYGEIAKAAQANLEYWSDPPGSG